MEKMTFSEKLKKARTDANMTQRELAVKLDITATTIYAWESGQRLPRYSRYYAELAEALKLDKDYFRVDEKEESKMLHKKVVISKPWNERRIESNIKAGKRLSLAIDLKNLTILEFAQITGFNKNHIWNMINGFTSIGLKNSIMFSKVLGVRREYLLMLDDFMTEEDRDAGLLQNISTEKLFAELERRNISFITK